MKDLDFIKYDGGYIVEMNEDLIKLFLNDPKILGNEYNLSITDDKGYKSAINLVSGQGFSLDDTQFAILNNIIQQAKYNKKFKKIINET
jgi:hypothetical protein